MEEYTIVKPKNHSRDEVIAEQLTPCYYGQGDKINLTEDEVFRHFQPGDLVNAAGVDPHEAALEAAIAAKQERKAAAAKKAATRRAALSKASKAKSRATKK